MSDRITDERLAEIESLGLKSDGGLPLTYELLQALKAERDEVRNRDELIEGQEAAHKYWMQRIRELQKELSDKKEQKPTVSSECIDYYKRQKMDK